LVHALLESCLGERTLRHQLFRPYAGKERQPALALSAQLMSRIGPGRFGGANAEATHRKNPTNPRMERCRNMGDPWKRFCRLIFSVRSRRPVLLNRSCQSQAPQSPLLVVQKDC